MFTKEKRYIIIRLEYIIYKQDLFTKLYVEINLLKINIIKYTDDGVYNDDYLAKKR